VANLVLPTLRQLLARFFVLFQVRKALRDVTEASGHAPADIALQIYRITDRITFALTLVPDILDYDPYVDTVRQTALDILPECLETYLDLPEWQRDNIPVQGTDPPQTARDILSQHLDIIEREMNAAVDALYQDQADAIELQGQYLIQKFGPIEGWAQPRRGDESARTALPPSHETTFGWLLCRLTEIQQPRFLTEEFQTWHADTKAALTRTFGPNHQITQAYHRIPWRTTEDPKQRANQEAMFSNSCQTAEELLHKGLERIKQLGLDKDAHDML